MGCDNKCENCSIEKMIEEIAECDFKCTGGPLEWHRGYMALIAKAKQLQAELAKYRYTRVGEGLPPKSDYYETLTTTSPNPVSCYYNNASKRWETTRVITHWRFIILPKSEGSE